MLQRHTAAEVATYATGTIKMISAMKTPTMLLLCFLLSLTPVESGSEAEIIKALEETQQEVAWKYIPLSGPSIDKASSKNITAQLGKTAVLNCRVKYLGGKTVSWMRARDLHLLTVGRFTYTSDERFRAVHQSGSDDWLLKIHYAQHRDAGSYECQVSTTPPVSTSIWLTVVAEPKTQVLGGPDLYINYGSTINLTCVVSHSDNPPPYIFWYHQSELLSYDSPRGGITVVTEHGPNSSSRLLIQRATANDAGQYSCRPANAEPHQINVHIIPSEYEHPAAIHHKNGTSSSLSIHGGSQGHYSFILSLILTLLSLSPNIILFCGSSRPFRCPNRSFRSNKREKDSEAATTKSYQLCHCSDSSPHLSQQISQSAAAPLSKISKLSDSSLRCRVPALEKYDKVLNHGRNGIIVSFTKTIMRSYKAHSHKFPLLTIHSGITHPFNAIHHEHHDHYDHIHPHLSTQISSCLRDYIPKS